MSDLQTGTDRPETTQSLSTTLLCYLLSKARTGLSEAVMVAEHEPDAYFAADARCARLMAEIGELAARLSACSADPSGSS